MVTALLPTTRKEAQRKASSHYFTGKPCIRGHVSIRSTGSKSCKGCNKEKSKTEYSKLIKAKWAKDNREVLKLRNRLWSKNNRAKDSAMKGHCQAVRREQIKSTLSSYEIAAIKYLYEDAKLIGYHVDHIIPLSKGGMHVLSNLQIVKPAYNLWKNNKVLS